MRTTSRLLTVLWVTQAVATVADPPISEPTKPERTEMVGVSMALLACEPACRGAAAPSARRPTAAELRQRLAQPLDHIPFDRRDLRLARLRGPLRVDSEVHHQQIAQLRERHWVVRPAD